MTPPTGVERRQFFRLRYPVVARPLMRTHGAEFAVAEVSEGGVVFFCHSLWAFALGEQVMASVRFSDGQLHYITGKVLRMKLAEIVVELAEPIPTRTIFREQVFVNRRRARLAAMSA